MSALSRELYVTFARLTRQGHSAKAMLYGFLAIAIGTVLNLGPLGVGIYLLIQGEIWKAIYVPILMYLYIGFYLAFWPVFFFVWWYNGTFLNAFFGTIGMLVVFAAPDWLMYRAMVAAEKADTINQKMTSLERGDNL